MIPIITYHGIGDTASPLWTPPAVFEAQLAAFATRGFRTVTLGTLACWLRDGVPPPEDAFVITFDDGYESVFREASPRLQAYGFAATVFLVTDYCGATNEWPGQGGSAPVSRLVSWSEAEALGRQGFELAAHTRSHPCLTVLTPAAMEDEVAASQAAVRERTGQEVVVFAYPYGDFNAAADRIVRRYFVGATTTRLGMASPSSDRYLLPRIDACYLRPAHIPHLCHPGYRGYLALRQAARSLRRQFRRDWRAPTPAPK